MHWTKLGLWGSIFFFLWGIQHLQASGEVVIPPDSCWLVQMNDNWIKKDGTNISFPYYEEGAPFEISYLFHLAPELPDPLYLYIERIAGKVEVMLDDRYVEILQTPFTSRIIPIDTGLFQGSLHRLRLICHPHQPFPFAPQPIQGILGKVGIFSPSSYAAQVESLSPIRPRMEDTVAVLAPYFGTKGYVFDSLSASRILLPVLKEKIEYIFFWFEPGPQFMGMCKALGLKRVKVLHESQVIALINYYPWLPVSHGKSRSFWLDDQLHRTAFHGSYQNWESVPYVQFSINDKVWLIFMGLFPFFAFFVVKLASPGFYFSNRTLVLSPKLLLDMGSGNLFSSPGLVLILTGLKVLGQTLWIGGGIYYLQISNHWHLIYRYFNRESLLLEIFSGNDALQEILLIVASLLLAWQLIRWSLLQLIGSVYRIKQLGFNGLLLEIATTYPFVLIVGLPWVAIILSSTIFYEWVLWGMALLSMIYFFRKIFLIYMGISRSFSFSLGMKILYICIFNILPYVIFG
ncbi:MAG: hypothetical protein AAFP00_00645 [Bacteroidota bacterium]